MGWFWPFIWYGYAAGGSDYPDQIVRNPNNSRTGQSGSIGYNRTAKIIITMASKELSGTGFQPVFPSTTGWEPIPLLNCTPELYVHDEQPTLAR